MLCILEAHCVVEAKLPNNVPCLGTRADVHVYIADSHQTVEFGLYVATIDHFQVTHFCVLSAGWPAYLLNS